MFSREVTCSTSRDANSPCAIVVQKMTSRDPQARPAPGDRVHFVVVDAPPGASLADRIACPDEIASRTDLRVALSYYIDSQVIPALGRCLHAMAIDINQWLPRIPLLIKKLMPFNVNPPQAGDDPVPRVRLCPLCSSVIRGASPVCASCLATAGPRDSLIEVNRRIKAADEVIWQCKAKCGACIAIATVTVSDCFCQGCDSFWKRKCAVEDIENLRSYRKPLERLCKSALKIDHFNPSKLRPLKIDHFNISNPLICM
jgi:hypothetical protein